MAVAPFCAWKDRAKNGATAILGRSEEHTSELQSQSNIVCRLLLEKKKNLTLITLSTGRYPRLSDASCVGELICLGLILCVVLGLITHIAIERTVTTPRYVVAP